jgi:hypothetical protein
MQWFIDLLTNPATDIVIHLMIAGLFVMELVQHWSHHRRNKRKRGEPTYTLDEARVLLFDEAVVKFKHDPAILHDVVKRG